MSYSPLPTNPFSTNGQQGGTQQGNDTGMTAIFGGGAWVVPRLRVAGNAPTMIHWSTAILVAFFALMAYQWSTGLSTLSRVFITILSPIFLVLSIWLHELGHAYAYYGIYSVWVEGIYLYAMGGLTTARLDASQAGRKSMMPVVSIAGPLVNGVLGGAMLLPFYLLRGSINSPLLLFLLSFHGWMQVALAVYNMIPGVPLDGSNALVGFLRFCFDDSKSKLIGYSIGLVFVIAAIVLVCIFISLGAGLFLILVLMYTGFALYELTKKPKSLTNPTY